MKNAACRSLFLTMFFAFAIILTGCREERSLGPDEGAGQNPSSPSTMRPADTQGAPVPRGEALRLLRFGPEGEVKKLNQVTAMFNQPMVALGDYHKAPPGALTTDPPLEGDLKWLNQYTLVLTPRAPLTGSLTLKAKLDPSALKALSGAALAEGAEVEITLPEIRVTNGYRLNQTPRDLDQALRPAWRVTFNQPLDLDSLKTKASFSYQAGGRHVLVPAIVERAQKDQNLTFVFTAREPLPPHTGYFLILGEGVRSLAGPQPGPELEAAGGSTYGPLSVKTSIPDDRPLFPQYGFTIYFSTPVDLAKVIPLIKLDNGYDMTPLLARFSRPDRPEPADESTIETNEAAGLDGEYESVENRAASLYIPGPFKGGTEYSLTVDGSAWDIFGQALGRDYHHSFKTGEYKTYLGLGNEYGLLETGSTPGVDLKASNIREAEIQGYALTAGQAAEFLAAARFSPGYYYDRAVREAEQVLKGVRPVVTTLSVPDGARNGPIALPLNLKVLFGDKYRGHFLYLRSTWEATGSDQKSHERHTFAMVQVSDIGLAVKVGPDSSLIWTTDLARGRSWPGVELELLDSKGRSVWNGRSDEDGLAALPGSRNISDLAKGGEPSFFVVARAEGQMALWNVNWDQGMWTWRWNIDSGNAFSRETETEDWLLNALPLYKPGETAKFKIISRQKNGDQLSNPAGEKLRVVIRDAQGQTVSDEFLSVGPFGTASQELKIPAEASVGFWTVSVGPADKTDLPYLGSFMVMTYRPPALEIEFENPPRDAVAGDEVKIGVKAGYHFGAPVAGQPVHYSVSAAPADFRLPGPFSAFSVVNRFQVAGEDNETDYEYSEPSVTVASDEAKLDQDGRLSFPLNLTPAPDQRPFPRNYQTYVTVTDVDQRQVSTSQGFVVHPADIYAGLSGDNFLAEAGRPYTLKVIAADRQGRLMADQKITVTLYRRTWQSVRRKTAGAAYDYVSRWIDEKVTEEIISTRGDLPAEARLTPEKGGFHWALAEVKDASGRTNQAAYSFYASGAGPVGWPMDNDDSLTLVTDKPEYQPGETARIMVQSPFDQGQGLLTVERAGVRQSRVFKIENQTPVLEVPLTEDDAPNVFISVLLARGRIADKLDDRGLDFGKPAIRLGYVELKMPTKKDLLAVSVTPNQSEIGPGDEVEVTVAVTDQQGRPFSEAEVALIAADAAVIQLGGDSAYFPDRHYHRDRQLLVQTGDNLVSLIGRQSLGLKGGNPGGGGGLGDGAALAAALRDQDGARRNFASLAWYEPGVGLDKNGRATVKIKMPENLTTFKIYAVATGHGRLSGTGQSSVLVSRDLLARSALPGYAGVGDEFQAAMVVSNRGQKAGLATVKLAGENFDLLEKSFEKTVEVKDGESREVGFRVKAGPEAEARFHFTVTMGDDRDSVEFAIPVSPPNQISTQASYERLTDGRWRGDLAVSEGLDPGRGGVEVVLSPSLVGVMSEPFAWMLAYPHGCVEQTASKAYANLIWLKLKDRLGGSAEQAETAGRQVKQAIANLTRWEQGGGYAFWPEGFNRGNRSVYLSAYVLDFLLTAREAGFKLPDPELIDRVSAFLKKSLSSDYRWPSGYSETSRRDTRAYSLAMLSRAGENVAAYIETRYNNRDNLSLFELINLIRALGRLESGADRDGRIKTLLPLLANHLQITAGEAQFVEPEEGEPEIWASSNRTSAMALIALCRSAPDHELIPALVRRLVSASRAGHFGTTQNNALTLAALAAYVQTLEPVNPEIEVTARLGSATLAQADFQAFTDPPVTGSAPLSAITQDDPAVVYEVKGRGQAWAALKLKTAPTEPDLSAAGSGDFTLSRTFTVVAPKAGRPGASAFQRGETVKVEVTMMVPAPRNNVVLVDRVPAGLEPVNFNLADADLTLKEPAGDNDGEMGWGPWYDHQEIWPDRVAVYAERLNAGVYTFSYLARAVTLGEYLTPGPRAEEMYAPEIYGRGEGQKLAVTDD